LLVPSIAVPVAVSQVPFSVAASLTKAWLTLRSARVVLVVGGGGAGGAGGGVGVLLMPPEPPPQPDNSTNAAALAAQYPILMQAPVT